MTTPPVSLDEFMDHLNMTEAADVGELGMMLEAATQTVEKRVGPLVARDVIETLESGGGDRLFPTKIPILELGDVTDPSGAVVAGPVVLGGMIVWPGGWFSRGWWTLEYSAGRGGSSDVPAALKLATMIIGKHLWETQRNAGLGRPGYLGLAPSTEPMTVVPTGFAVPYRAEQLMDAYQQDAVSL